MDSAAIPGPDSSPQPPVQVADLDLDLAFEAATDLAPGLLSAAGVWADPLAGADPWHALFSGWLRELAAELPEPLQWPGYSLGLSLVSDAEIAALNADWRGKPGPTDVLAFAAQDADLDGDALDSPELEGRLVFSDLISGSAPHAQCYGAALNEGEAWTEDDSSNSTDDEDDLAEDDAEGDVDATAAAKADDDDPENEDEDPESDDDAEHDEDEADNEHDDLMAASELLELGDIVISLDTAARQCEENGQTLEEELKFLACHGLLHLLGWDHPDAESLEAMLRRQDLLLRRP